MPVVTGAHPAPAAFAQKFTDEPGLVNYASFLSVVDPPSND